MLRLRAYLVGALESELVQPKATRWPGLLISCFSCVSWWFNCTSPAERWRVELSAALNEVADARIFNGIHFQQPVPMVRRPERQWERIASETRCAQLMATTTDRAVIDHPPLGSGCSPHLDAGAGAGGVARSPQTSDVASL
jgi:hypothetical protein